AEPSTMASAPAAAIATWPGTTRSPSRRAWGWRTKSTRKPCSASDSASSTTAPKPTTWRLPGSPDRAARKPRPLSEAPSPRSPPPPPPRSPPPPPAPANPPPTYPPSLPPPAPAAPLFDQNAGRPPRQYQWSMGIQREIMKDLAVEAAYVGNRGIWWNAPGLLNL